MFTKRHLLNKLSPRKLDEYLARGWYRSGQSVFTCNFLLKEGNLFTVVWTRMPLDGHTFRKGQRKLLRKVRSRFRIVIQPEQPTVEKERLYQLYRLNFKGHTAPSLRSSLLDNQDDNLFDSREIMIYDGDKLVGFSIFDLGEDSVQSIKGVYHPDYKSYSLGYYTMLEEVEFAKEQGKLYYYAGYVVPGYDAFDYKLRVGNKEFYDTEAEQWRPWTEFDPDNLLHKVMRKKLNLLQGELGRRGIPTRPGIYPLYETVFWDLEPRYHFNYPLVLQVYPDFHNYRYLNFVYDPQQKQYRFVACTSLQDVTEHLAFQLQPDPEIPIITELLGMTDNFLAGDKPKEAIYRMKMWISRQMYL